MTSSHAFVYLARVVQETCAKLQHCTDNEVLVSVTLSRVEGPGSLLLYASGYAGLAEEVEVSAEIETQITAAGAAEPEYGFSRVFPDFHPRVKRLVAELGMTLSPVPSGARDNVFAYGGTFMQRDAVTIRGKPVKVFLSDVMRQLVEAHSTDFAAPFESEKLLSTNLRGLMGNLVSDDEFAA